MSTYVIKQTSQFDDLTAEDLMPFVDASGRLDVRIEGGAVTRPFAVLNVLRSAGFLRTHTWVETDADDDRSPVTLRVTAVLPGSEATPVRGPRLLTAVGS